MKMMACACMIAFVGLIFRGTRSPPRLPFLQSAARRKTGVAVLADGGQNVVWLKGGPIS